MQLAAPNTHARPTPAHSDSVVVTSADPAAFAAVPGSDPASVIMRRNGLDFMALAGVSSVGWSRSQPGQVTITFADDAFRALGSNVLRDSVEGVRLVLETAANAPALPQLPWWTNSDVMMRNAVRAMNGVIESQTIVEHGFKQALMYVDSQATADRVKPIVKPVLGDWNTWFLVRSS